MLKIHCRECGRSFIWTDEMPVRGKCPNPDCEGDYDVHAGLRDNLDTRIPDTAQPLLCPACGKPIRSCWTVCDGCGRIVAGARTFRKRDLLVITAVLLLVISVIVRLWIRL